VVRQTSRERPCPGGRGHLRPGFGAGRTNEITARTANSSCNYEILPVIACDLSGRGVNIPSDSNLGSADDRGVSVAVAVCAGLRFNNSAVSPGYGQTVTANFRSIGFDENQPCATRLHS